ncbi:MAG TPA: long-chain fatty acid--CoA ligase [Actinomycetota bacterium]
MATTTHEVLAERAAIDAEVEGKTICDLLLRNADDYPARPAISWQEGTTWHTLNWREYRDRVAALALALRRLGVARGTFVAIMARNRVEHVIADLAIVHAGGTPVSLYNTLAPEQISYIANHCQARMAILEGREFMERWEKVKAELPSLEHVILMDDHEDFAGYDWVRSWDSVVTDGTEALGTPEGRAEFEQMWREVNPEDLATLVYTSGTTGPPKAVMITHRNVVWTVSSLNRDLKYPIGLKAVSYLPLAHVAERMATHYLGMYKLAHSFYCPDVLRVFEVVPEVRPQAFLGVPRVWEKLQAGVMAAIGAEPNARKRKIAMAAIDAGRQAARLEAEGKPVPLALRAKRALFERLVFSKIREKIGLDRCILSVTSAAPISKDTLEFFAGIGLPLLEVYGMTENSGPATANPPERIKMATVGLPLPGVEVKLADDGEILVRGGNISPGYYKDPEKTSETFDADGWLHTGDIGTIDEDGYFKVIDRKKELIITAGGKNISPSNLEALLKSHPLVGQACVIGDGKKYVSALIVLDGEAAPIWARENGIDFTGVPELAADPRITAEIQRAIDDANQHVSQVERIKRFTILPTEWTVDSEELTPTLKLKRRVIHQKYAEEIESLYA